MNIGRRKDVTKLKTYINVCIYHTFVIIIHIYLSLYMPLISFYTIPFAFVLCFKRNIKEKEKPFLLLQGEQTEVMSIFVFWFLIFSHSLFFRIFRNLTFFREGCSFSDMTSYTQSYQERKNEKEPTTTTNKQNVPI